MSGWRYTKSRSTEAELMDSEPVSFAEFQDCLRDLKTINRWTLAYRPTLRWLRAAIRQAGATPLSLFDIGSGGGDMLRQIRRQLGADSRALRLTGIDLNPWSKASAEAATASDFAIAYETVSIFALAPTRQADFIISSLFTHHLSDADLIAFIRWMEARAMRGWLINDLHRHFVPYYFIKYAVRLFGLNRLVLHDAPISVARAFRRRDWQQLMREAGIDSGVTIRWAFPFRYIVARRK